MKHSAGIIGYGRFGKVLEKILESDFHLKIYDPYCEDIPKSVRCDSPDEVTHLPLVFVAVPIRNFEKVIGEISRMLSSQTTVVDVCSVKTWPAEVMSSLLPENAGIICSHPLFGPDSYSPYRELKIMMHPLRDIHGQYPGLKKCFENQSIRVVEMTPEEHDRLAAGSQGITHFIGRVLELAGVRSTPINTLGFTDLLGVIEQTCNDSHELFKDLQKYNPYTNETINRLESAIRETRQLINNQQKK